MSEVELTAAETTAAYDCLKPAMKSGYAKSGVEAADYYMDWKMFSSAPYASGTHGGRYVSNYANKTAEKAYGGYENTSIMPVGAVIAKDSIAVQADGRAVAGPLFVMEKMSGGFNGPSRDWKYTLILPNGQVAGTTNGAGSGNVAFCYECHMAAEENDSLFFLPDEFRVK